MPCCTHAIKGENRIMPTKVTFLEGVTLRLPQVIYCNVCNDELIDNLPDGCVEAACLVNQNGI